MNKLYKTYKTEIVPKLMTEFKYKSVMQVPRITKIVINSGVSDAVQNHNAVSDVRKELGLISGQRPVVTKARKSIAAFKLRTGMSTGVKVTLRRDKMYSFLEKLINVALPRVRDFRGLNKNSFDNQANYSLGIKEQIIFPEIDYDKIHKLRGMDITIVTDTNDRDAARQLLKYIGLPFKK